MAERFGEILMRLMYFRVKRRNLKEFVILCLGSRHYIQILSHALAIMVIILNLSKSQDQ